MKDVGYVTGSAEQAQELVIGTDVVYVHSEITLVEPKEGEERPSPVYRYHEIQYEKNEYIKLMMGHKSTEVGERVYTHKTIEELANALALVTN